MNIKKFKFCTVSADETCNVLSSLRKQRYATDPTIQCVFSNKESLCKVYNSFIDHAIKDNIDWIVLVHSDVEIEVNDVCDRILQPGYDVVGVAGTTQVKLESPALWHLMGGGFQGGNLRGAVAHGAGRRVHMTSFGPYPERCVMIDGVFMAISRPVFENIRFDETNPAKFHFYDLSYSLECHNNKYKVGVGNIPIIHQSPGLREFTDEWKAGEKWFLEKFNK